MTKRIFFYAAAIGMMTVANAKTMSDKDLGKYSAKVAANLLANNVEDKHGLLLLKFAEVFNPTSEDLLLTKALLKRAKPPVPVKTKATKEKLVNAFVTRAQYWYKKDIKKDVEARYKAILYYKVIDSLTPKEPINDVIITLAKIDNMGYSTDLDRLFESGEDAVKTDEDYTAPSELAAEPVLSPHQSSYYEVVDRKRLGKKGPRGSIEHKNGDMTLRLTSLNLYPARDTFPSTGSLTIKWTRPKPSEYVSWSIEPPLTILDNNKKSIDAKYIGTSFSFFRTRPLDSWNFNVSFSDLDPTIDRISLLKGTLLLNQTKEVKTLVVSLPLKNTFTKNGFTITKGDITPTSEEFNLTYREKGGMSMAAVRSGMTVIFKFSDHSESNASRSSSSSSTHYFSTTYRHYTRDGRKPVEIKITYPAEITTERYPFEFRNIGLPDKTGNYLFKGTIR